MFQWVRIWTPQMAAIACLTIIPTIVVCFVLGLRAMRKKKKRMDKIYGGDYKAWRQEMRDLRKKYR